MSGTDKSKAGLSLDGPIVILVEPQLGENIGMAARAMGNFALSSLRIVNPRDGWPAWTQDGRLLVVGSVSHGGGLAQSLSCVDVHRGRPLWRGALPMVADRPAAPLGAGAVIQVWDPARACAEVGAAPG